MLCIIRDTLENHLYSKGRIFTCNSISDEYFSAVGIEMVEKGLRVEKIRKKNFKNNKFYKIFKKLF